MQDKTKTRIWRIIYWTVFGAIFITIVSLSFPAILKYLPPKDSNELTAVSSYSYTLLTFCMFATVLYAAILTIHQVSEAVRSRKLVFVLEAYKAYSTTDMRKAIRTMWRDSKNIKEFISGQEVYNDSKDEDRRRVSDFWNMIGWAVKANLIEADLIQLRFQEGPMIWQRLYPIELQIQLNSENYAKLSEQERNEKAQHHVENLLGHWLYTEWISEYNYDGPELNYDYYLFRLAEADNKNEKEQGVNGKKGTYVKTKKCVSFDAEDAIAVFAGVVAVLASIIKARNKSKKDT